MRPLLLSSIDRRRRASAGQRGFSLIELVVVVIIIAVLAVIAVPAVTQRMRDRRVYDAAQEVVSIYRGARMRAMGRGAAVLVRYDSANNGSLKVQEAVRGSTEPDPKCQMLPTTSCTLPTWVTPTGTNLGNVTDNVLVSTFEPGIRKEYDQVVIEMNGAPGDSSKGNTMSDMDVCFTPLGRTYVRYAQNGPWTPLGGIPTAKIYRKGETGLARTVMVMPNGAARFGTAEAAP